MVRTQVTSLRVVRGFRISKHEHLAAGRSLTDRIVTCTPSRNAGTLILLLWMCVRLNYKYVHSEVHAGVCLSVKHSL